MPIKSFLFWVNGFYLSVLLDVVDVHLGFLYHSSVVYVHQLNDLFTLHRIGDVVENQAHSVKELFVSQRLQLCAGTVNDVADDLDRVCVALLVVY